MKAKLFFLVTILTVLCYSGIAYAGEEITLTTYYPAPYGEYGGLAVGNPNNGYTAPADPIDLIVEGNVGIGTTSPGQKLDVSGTIQGSDYVSGGSNSWIFHTPDDGRTTLYIAPGTNGGSWDWSKQTAFYNNGNVYHTGNVGIGTTGPDSALDLNGAFSVRGMSEAEAGASQAGQGRIYFDSTSNNFKVSENGGAYEDLGIGAGGDGGWTDDGTIVRLTTATDNVGIGTTNPQARLDVAGRVKDSDGKIQFGAWTSASVDTVYEAATDGFVVAYIYCSVSPTGGHIKIKTDGSNPPTTMRAVAYARYENATQLYIHFDTVTVPVRKGDYWIAEKVNVFATSPAYTVYWLPARSE